jgi:hypothetical protein
MYDNFGDLDRFFKWLAFVVFLLILAGAASGTLIGYIIGRLVN